MIKVMIFFVQTTFQIFLLGRLLSFISAAGSQEINKKAKPWPCRRIPDAQRPVPAFQKHKKDNIVSQMLSWMQVWMQNHGTESIKWGSTVMFPLLGILMSFSASIRAENYQFVEKTKGQTGRKTHWNMRADADQSRVALLWIPTCTNCICLENVCLVQTGWDNSTPLILLDDDKKMI